MHQLFIDFKRTCDSVGWVVLNNIGIEFGIPMELVRLIKMCLNETYSRVQVDRHLFDMFPNKTGLKHVAALSPFLFSFALECAIRRVQVHQDGLKLNGRHQLLVNADNDNLLGRSVHTIKKNLENFVVSNKEIGLEVTTDKTKYVYMCQDQNAGGHQNIKFDTISFQSLEQLKYL